ncbi:MAG: DUF4389 domain-containing protein [Acidimicrobiia bacterium]
MQPSRGPDPVTFSFDPPERIANWRPLVHWLLVVPHWAIAYVLRTVSEVLAIVSWFAIVFTGSLPEGLARFQALSMRYGTRAMTYALFLREEYPPFTFDTVASDPGDDPRVRVDVVPQLADRNRVTTAFRFILAIPHVIVLGLLGMAACIVVLIGGIAVLFTGRWPEGLREFVVGVLRYSLRFDAYVLLLTDEYPPFSVS